ncbi:hypothetical protein DUNSADRAFT_576 [Dunaliella salina]|uniref:STI1 domain-containing protein n=1 Tax=Dunaliella salina TaxID=3046 RepID=A0ABQ7GY24_DUNSA|nr:hypothetical protein DUNSADRAFT_576 [Dunaliella salina]|eukprot:KAF5839505.1 hypothetical protein DUNSADRAFT_576 [Dunaliella salina]
MKCFSSKPGLVSSRHRVAGGHASSKPPALLRGPRLPPRISLRTMAQAGSSVDPSPQPQEQQQVDAQQQQQQQLPQLQPYAPPPEGQYVPPPAPMVMPPPPPPLNPDGTPMSTATYMPQYPPQGYPGMPVRSPQEMYMASPYAYPPPPPPAYRAEETSSGLPWWLFVGIGVVVGGLIGKVQEYMKNPKTPQQMMTEMAMKQMMGAMGGPGAKPGGFPGGMPGGMPPGFPPGFPPTPPPPSATSGPSTTVDVPSYETAERKGDKFNNRFSAEGSPSPSSDSGSAAAASSSSTASSSEQDSMRREAAATAEAIDPIVKEPTSSSERKKSASSFFADVAAEDAAKKASSQSAGGQQTGGEAGSGATMSQMMEQMMRDPEMQKMLYPYLPEPMRNPTSIEWMLSNPEVKKQMSEMFESQNMMSPQMMEMMKSMDFNQDKVNAQFQELGLKPEDVISKVMSNPELAAGFSNPKVQAAIMDISQNPMNVVKYNDQPEIMKVLEKVTEVFKPDVPPNSR